MITFKALTPTGEFINSALSPFTFPAGETHVKNEERRSLEAVEIAILQFNQWSMNTDLFHLAMWANYMRIQNIANGNYHKTVAVIPYWPAARMDRGVPFGLKVYTDFINSLELDHVLVFDPHSQATPREATAMPAGVRDRKVEFLNPGDLFAETSVQAFLPQYAGIIAPDTGAVQRAQQVANVLDLPIFKAIKKRDMDTGKLSGFECEPLPAEGKFLIVDDICDGGGTFLGLAAATGLPKERLDLYVSHGIFSGHAELNLPQHFDRIFSTNSYIATRALQNVTRFDVIRLLLSKVTQ